jgi:hypothetical protein
MQQTLDFGHRLFAEVQRQRLLAPRFSVFQKGLTP